MKTVEVSAKYLAHCSVRPRLAADLSRQDVSDLMHWCDGQTEALWDDMSLQEILNVYRVSAEWDTWEVWASEDRVSAHAAWDRAVIDPGNRMAR